MTDDPVVFAIVLLLTGEAIVSIGAAVAMRMRYGRRLIDSIIWDRLVASELRTVVASLLILALTLYGLLRIPFMWPPVPQPWGVLALGVALALLMWGPISDWWMLREIERGHDREDAP